MKKSTKLILGALVVASAALTGFFGFKAATPAQAASKTVTVGVMSGTKQEDAIWNQVKQTAKSKYGITVQLKEFTDYTQPNKALADGNIDLNEFQHYAFLNAWNKANKGTLTPIGQTIIAPIRLYSKQYKSVSAIKKGSTIAVPNDASNESRALFLLKNAKLITLKPTKKNALVTVKDIAKNPKNLQIKEMDASQTARTLSNTAAAVVNNTYVPSSGLTLKQSIYTEPVNKDSQQWINIFVARKADKNNKTYQDVVKSYQTKAVKNVIKKQYGGLEYAVWDTKIK